MRDYRYYRWGGWVVRHPPGDVSSLQVLRAGQWEDAPPQAVEAVESVDAEGASRSGFCVPLTTSEAARMVEALGGIL